MVKTTKFILALFLCLISSISTAQVKTGIEVLESNGFDILKGKNVGLLTNATGIDRHFCSTIDILHNAKEVNLVCLFAPEHGVRGDVYAGGTVSATKDPKTGLKVHSLYGKTKRPTAEMMKGLDVIVYDIQDVGCRSYTFISSLGKVMDAAGEYGVEVVVLDRPNPLGGEKIEGPLVKDGYVSFISQFPIPYIYGLTVGELAKLMNEEGMITHKCKLKVVGMEGWKRNMKFSDTGLPWVLTSPAIPTSDHPMFYPLSGIVGELPFLSIGVGYTLPFQTFAAPWVSSDSLADELNSRNIDGIHFRPITYKPYFGAFKTEVVNGVQVYITDYEKARLTEVQFHVLCALHKLYPNKEPIKTDDNKSRKTFDNVCGTKEVRESLFKNFDMNDFYKVWRRDEDSFRNLSKKYYLY